MEPQERDRGPEMDPAGVSGFGVDGDGALNSAG